MYAFIEHGLGDGPPLTSRKTAKFGFIHREVMHPLEMLGEQSFCSICNGAHIDFANPHQPHPS